MSRYLLDIELWRELTYFDFMTKVSHTRKPWSHFSNLAKQRVRSCFPRYKPIPTDPDFEDFARVKLMLHHPHTDVDHLKTVDGIHYDTFAAAYQFCVEVHA
jgi:ATP-dependent DNA helicase PIF1